MPSSSWEKCCNTAVMCRQARSVDRKRQWALQLKSAILESYGVDIPKHARELVMKLGQHRENGESTAVGELGGNPGQRGVNCRNFTALFSRYWMFLMAVFSSLVTVV